ncbi:MAG: hypothetical protein A2804_00975 [Candidatus Pacebacteria bacterium RIFCSPHIGHO2_01_FULL_46_10]|nr:MAG: hypothetical protein A2804_00975 [Candidatus Pacebacteria bacterium RIFCSPHIGHO2_01_FULL_46_10]
MAALQFNAIQSTTQNYLEIYDVTNDLVILRDGTVALLLTTNSLNFGLLSEEEQDSIIYTYAGLLNSLSFPIEIVIRSQKKDISVYLHYVEELEQKNPMPIRKTQIRRYREFIQELVKERNILDKKFYIAIPFAGASLSLSGAIPNIKKKETFSLDKAYVLEKAKTDLEPKRDHLIAQFARIGLYARQLTTQEIIHLMYTIYNPGTSEGQRMTDTGSYTTPLVEASLQGVMSQPALQSFTKDADVGEKTSPAIASAPTALGSAPQAQTPIPAQALPPVQLEEKPIVQQPAPTPSLQPEKTSGTVRIIPPGEPVKIQPPSAPITPTMPGASAQAPISVV